MKLPIWVPEKYEVFNSPDHAQRSSARLFCQCPLCYGKDTAPHGPTHTGLGGLLHFPRFPTLLAAGRRASHRRGGCVIGAAAALTRAVAAAVVAKGNGALVVDGDAGGRTAVPLRLHAGAHRADGDLRAAQPTLTDSPQWQDLTLGGRSRKVLRTRKPAVAHAGCGELV